MNKDNPDNVKKIHSYHIIGIISLLNPIICFIIGKIVKSSLHISGGLESLMSGVVIFLFVGPVFIILGIIFPIIGLIKAKAIDKRFYLLNLFALILNILIFFPLLREVL